jgi:hypothetical protein
MGLSRARLLVNLSRAAEMQGDRQGALSAGKRFCLRQNALAVAWATVCGMRARGRGRKSDVLDVFEAGERFPRRLA